MPAYYNEIDPLAQAKFCGWVTHPVDQSVAGRAKYPNHIRPFAIPNASPLTISFKARLMGKVQNAMFATGLAGYRSLRIMSSKADQVRVRQLFRLRPLSVKRLALRIAQMPLPHLLRVPRSTTLIGADALLVRVLGGEKLRSTNTAFPRSVSVLRRKLPAECSTAFLRAKLTAVSLVSILSSAVVAGALSHTTAIPFLARSRHEEMGLLQRHRPIRLSVGGEFNRCGPDRPRRGGLSVHFRGQCG